MLVLVAGELSSHVKGLAKTFVQTRSRAIVTSANFMSNAYYDEELVLECVLFFFALG